jgi:drug/metabolite transporter (DMT)-like permease
VAGRAVLGRRPRGRLLDRLSDAERHLSSSMAGLLIAAVPIIGIVLAGSAERLGVKRWAGLVLGLCGVAVLAVPHLRGGTHGR